jgi:protocatechuate 3,4-dioxygenase beta subunit
MMALVVTLGLLGAGAAAHGVAMPAQRAPQQRPAQTGTASIRGRIVAADTGKPLRRAQITLSAPELGSQPRTANTNADGRYEIKDLPAGRYTVSVSRSGYLPLRYGQRRPLEQAKPLEVLDRQAVEHIDFALPRMGLIAGRIFDELGEPIAGVRVSAMRSVYLEGHRRLVSAGGGLFSTDDAGQYRLPGLVPGSYFVMATTHETWTVNTAGRRDVMGFVPTYFPGTGNAGEAKRVTVGIGQQVRNADFALIVGRTASVSGVALDSHGRPLAGQSVGLEQEFRSATTGSGFEGLGSAPIAADGTFTFRNVAAGEYNLRARNASGPGRQEDALMAIEVNGVDINDIVLTSSAGWSVSGHIITEDGTAPDIPRDRIRIAVRPLTGGTSRPIMGSGEVKDDLTFSAMAIVGTARLRVTLPDRWMVKAVLHDGRDIADAAIEMKSGEELSGLQVIVTDRATNVTGQLTDDKGAPLVDGTVIVFAGEAEKWSEDSRFVRSARPDQQGKFEIRGLPPGEYLAVAIDYVQEGLWNDPEYLESIRRYAQKFTLRESGTAVVSLKLVTP